MSKLWTMPKQLAKPQRWGPLSVGLVAPEWRWFYRDLVALVPMWEGGDRARDFGPQKIVPDTTGTQPPWEVTRYGRGLGFGSSESISYGQPGWINGASAFSVGAVCLVDDITADHAVIWKGSSGFPAGGAWALWFDDGAPIGTDVWEFITSDGATTVRSWTSSGFVNANQWYHVVGVGEVGQAHKIYVDGKDETANTESTQSAAMGSLAEDVAIGGSGDQLGRLYSGSISLVAVWRRVLLANEIAQWASDPFGPLRLYSPLPVGFVSAVAARRIFIT